MYEVIRDAKQIIVHPEYDFSGEGFRNDAALLEMPQPFRKAPIKHVTFLSLEEETERASSGTLAIAAGWGLMEGGEHADGLRAVQVNLLTPEDCRSISQLSTEIVHDRILCGRGYGKGIKAGDSGGPLLLRDESDLLSDEWIQIGIASQSTTRGENITSIYTRTSSILDWIQNRKSIISDPTAREEASKIKERLDGTEGRLDQIEEMLELLEDRVAVLEEE